METGFGEGWNREFGSAIILGCSGNRASGSAVVVGRCVEVDSAVKGGWG